MQYVCPGATSIDKDNVEESKVKSWPVHKVMLPEKAVEEISVTR